MRAAPKPAQSRAAVCSYFRTSFTSCVVSSMANFRPAGARGTLSIFAWANSEKSFGIRPVSSMNFFSCAVIDSWTRPINGSFPCEPVVANSTAVCAVAARDLADDETPSPSEASALAGVSSADFADELFGIVCDFRLQPTKQQAATKSQPTLIAVRPANKSRSSHSLFNAEAQRTQSIAESKPLFVPLCVLCAFALSSTCIRLKRTTPYSLMAYRRLSTVYLLIDPSPAASSGCARRISA